MNVDRIVIELRERGFNANRRSVGAVDSSLFEYEEFNSEELCSIHVSRGKQLAEIVWFADGHIVSIFVVSDDLVFRADVADAFFALED